MLTQKIVTEINQLLIESSLKVAQIYGDYVNNNIDIGVQKKSDTSPVTMADKLLHTIISEKLAELTPDIFCLSEESEEEINNRHQLKALWLLDPVDGTRAFIGKTGEFTINLALVYNQQVIASWLVVPMQAQLYFYVSEKTVLNTENGNKFSQFLANQIYACHFLNQFPAHLNSLLLKDVSSSRLDESFKSLTSDALPLHSVCAQQAGVIKVGLSRSAQLSDYQSFFDALKASLNCEVIIVQASSAYKFVQMMRNEIDVYIRAYPTCEWDTASGQGFIECLGGRLINFRGNPFLYNHRSSLINGGFVCFKNSKDKPLLLNACQNLVEEE